MVRRRLGFWRRSVAMFLLVVVNAFTRRTWSGQQHIPATGGVIIVPNHVSHADPLIAAHFVYCAGRWPQYLAKASVFAVPVVGWLLLKVKQIPVERGTVEAAKSLEALTAALSDGGTVIIYAEGTTSREPDLWPMRGKTGAARLALATGAPVIPVAMWGPQRIFDPRTRKVRIRPRSPVTVKAGPPVDLSRWAGAPPNKETLDEMTEAIMLRIRDLLAEIRGGTPPPLWAPASARRTADPGPASEAVAEGRVGLQRRDEPEGAA
ncbi:MAG TPA: lysophospholipid acyltransferase family protein [Pilimelia sp.]|nr:lysophospholipid acyltransferase family protein [Pilimelia sp.]